MSNWNWKLLRAGNFRLDGGAMFGVIPKALWARMAPPDEANRIPLQTNCVYLEKDERKVLIETGYGNKFGAKDTKIFALERRWIDDALQEIGVQRSEITDVILSHLHFDHAGGLTFIDASTGQVCSSFPNATIYTQESEWNDALANKSTMTKTYLREHLDPIAKQIHLLNGEQDVFGGISVCPVPGHTWGQQAILFEDGKGTICFPGDMMPTIHHVGSAFNMAYDMLPHQNMLTKQEMLSKAHALGWRIILDHEPGPAVVSVGKNEKGRFALQVLEEYQAG